MPKHILIRLALLASLTLGGAGGAGAQTQSGAVSNTTAAAVHGEEIRATCLQGRRIICGRILKVLPGGLLVDSGYASLLRPPVNHSWLVPSTVTATKDPNLVEANEPDAVCGELVFLTDIPRSRLLKPKVYDYVNLKAYPAGQYTYVLSGDQKKDIRRFAAGLETAIRLNLSAEEKVPAVPPGAGK